MCRQEKEICQKPEALRGVPHECSSEQIKICHGDAKEHPCDEKAEEE